MGMFSNYDDLLTVPEVASVLQVDRHVVYRLIKNKSLNSIQPSKSHLIPKISLISYVIGSNTQCIDKYISGEKCAKVDLCETACYDTSIDSSSL